MTASPTCLPSRGTHLLIYSLGLRSLVSSPVPGGGGYFFMYICYENYLKYGVHKNMTCLSFFINKTIIIIICDVQLFPPLASLLILSNKTLSLGTFSSPIQTIVSACCQAHDPVSKHEHMAQAQIIILSQVLRQWWSGSGNVTQAIAIRVSPFILLSETSRKLLFLSDKACLGCDECQPSGDLVLYTLKIPERVKLTPKDKLHRQHPGSGKSPSQRFPVTATLPLHLWAFIYSYNEHVFKQVGIQFLSFVPKEHFWQAHEFA